MATNFVQEGGTISWTNGTGDAVVSGQVVAIGNILGVAAVDIANGAVGTVYVEGVFTCPKASGATTHDFAQGAAVYWDASAGKFEKTGTGTLATGDLSGSAVAWEAAASTATTAKIKINQNVGSVT